MFGSHLNSIVFWRNYTVLLNTSLSERALVSVLMLNTGLMLSLRHVDNNVSNAHVLFLDTSSYCESDICCIHIPQTPACIVIRLQRMQETATQHTHPFNDPLFGTTRVSQHQKGKTNLDFTEARDSEWQWHQLDHMQVCTSLQTDNHASTPPLSVFTGQMPFLLPNQQHQSTEGKLPHKHP